uniref:Uncharacterized protein n=1 Tax=Oryza rufipogon TaxID=4529 RepID=A0A0E0NK36_ORYRU
MATILENIQKARFLPTRPLKDELPTFQGGGGGGGGGGVKESHLMGLRKRLSSFSDKIQPISSASAEWAFRRSKSAPSLGAFAGGPLKRWWDWGVGWLMSKKPGFATDLEMNEEEVAALGRGSRGSWGHILYKMRSGVRRLVTSHSLPTTHRAAAAASASAQCKPAATFNYTQSFHSGQTAMAY